MVNDTDRINCTIVWLDKAIGLHKVHMDDPSTATQESQELLNKQILNAKKCLTRNLAIK